jgi:hypothetical protein
MSEEQFFEEMENRRQQLNLGPNDHVIGCPLCLAPLVAPVQQADSGSDAEPTNEVALQERN